MKLLRHYLCCVIAMLQLSYAKKCKKTPIFMASHYNPQVDIVPCLLSFKQTSSTDDPTRALTIVFVSDVSCSWIKPLQAQWPSVEQIVYPLCTRF